MNPGRNTKPLIQAIEGSAEMQGQQKQTRYVREHSHCAMCESQLEIHHEIDTQELKVKEEAYCPQCSILVRRSQHLMH